MTKSLSNTLMLILAGIGCVLALLLTIEYVSPDKFTLPCSVQGVGCSGTLHSVYSHWGPIPTSGFGLAMYALIVALCLMRKKLLMADREAEAERARAYAASEEDPASDLSDATTASSAVTPLRAQIKRLDLFVFLLALSGLCISWWLQYVSIWVVGSFCPYCFTSALIVSALCAFASRDYLLDGRALSGEQKMLGVVLGFILIMLGFIFVPQALQIIQMGLSQADREKPVEHTDVATLKDVLIRPDMHILGDPKSKYLLVEFADYLCPHCAEASKIIPDLLKNRPDVHLAFRNYPLGYPHVKFQHSDEASNAAEAAGMQGKFWQVHDYLFEHQEEIKLPTFSASKFKDVAQQFGLNVDQFIRDMQSDAIIQRVQQDHSDGDRARTQMTPTFFLVTPDKVTSFVGGDELRKAMNNPNDKMWK